MSLRKHDNQTQSNILNGVLESGNNLRKNKNILMNYGIKNNGKYCEFINCKKHDIQMLNVSDRGN